METFTFLKCFEMHLDILSFSPADISLADFGRKELIMAENEMPGLMHIRFLISSHFDHTFTFSFSLILLDEHQMPNNLS